MTRFVAALVIVLLGLGIGGLWMDYRKYVSSSLNIMETTYFEIGKGMGLAEVAGNLAARGILTKPNWFRLAAYARGVHRQLKYGEYEIPKGTTPASLLKMFVEGRVRQYQVTVVEGWTFRDMLAALARHPALLPVASSKPPAEVMALLGVPGQPAEGRFFPDTYFVTKGTPDLEVLKRAHVRMKAMLAREWQERSNNLPLGTSDEALILASIIEKEAARSEERPAVAGVFVRRLAKGMRLQTDPTVIYGMGSAYSGNIRKSDLRRDTPYNTYTRHGLPPTPIALPGLHAIHAALHPDDGTSLYFVSRGDGSHVFSSTLQAHQRAVRKYQKH